MQPRTLRTASLLMAVLASASSGLSDTVPANAPACDRAAIVAGAGTAYQIDSCYDRNRLCFAWICGASGDWQYQCQINVNEETSDWTVDPPAYGGKCTELSTPSKCTQVSTYFATC